MIDGIVMKGKRAIIPFQLKKHILQKLHSHFMGIVKMRILACEMVYWLNMITHIGNTVKQCATFLDYQNTQLQEKQCPNELLLQIYFYK